MTCVLICWGFQPGIFAQGPEEKFAQSGFVAGFIVVILCSILADGLALVGEG